MSVKITKDDVPAVLKTIQKMVSSDLLIGIPSFRAGRHIEADVAAAAQARGEVAAIPLNSAAIGYIQETGSPINNIPARPFLVPGVAAIQEKAIVRLKKGLSDALDHSPVALGQALEAVGLMAQASVRNTINSGIGPPLKASTLSARRRRGRTGEVPLIDTAQLRNSITFVMREKK